MTQVYDRIIDNLKNVGSYKIFEGTLPESDIIYFAQRGCIFEVIETEPLRTMFTRVMPKASEEQLTVNPDAEKIDLQLLSCYSDIVKSLNKYRKRAVFARIPESYAPYFELRGCTLTQDEHTSGMKVTFVKRHTIDKKLDPRLLYFFYDDIIKLKNINDIKDRIGTIPYFYESFFNDRGCRILPYDFGMEMTEIKRVKPMTADEKLDTLTQTNPTLIK